MSNRSTVRRPQLDERTADHLAETFKALSDRSRLRLIAALMGAERCVGELAADLAMSESAVSHQLRTLRQLRLVRVRKNGRQVFYALDDEHIEELFRCGLEHVRHG
jgi:DNA-binding transcriptional ArsR family regulator